MKFSAYVVGAVSLAVLVGCSNRDPEWDVELASRDAFNLAAVILSHGKIEGCGEFEVTSQYPRSHEIWVSCRGTKHELTYWPVFKVDHRDVARSAWEETSLGTAYCVKAADGNWDAAYLDLSDAHDRARALSRESGKPTTFYASDSLLYWETRQAEDGRWVSAAPTDEVKDRDDRRGCELEKNRLDHQHG